MADSMDKKYSNVPNLRFIDESWSKSTIGQDCLFVKDGTHGTHKDSQEGVPLLSAKDIHDSIIDIDNNPRLISLNEYNLIYKKIQPKANDVLITIVGTVGRTAIIPDNFPKFAFQRSVGWLRCKDTINSSFYNQLLNSRNVQNSIFNKINASAQGGIYLNSLETVSTYIPSIQTQEKIALFLDLINERISTQNKIIEEIISLKNSIIQQIFSNRGLIPNTNKVSLNKILVPGSKTPVDTSQYKKITIKLNYGGIEFSNLEREMKDTRPFYVRKTGELIIGKQNYFNGSIAILDEKYDGTICSNAIMSFIFDKEVDPIFVFTAVSNRQFLKAKSFYANGTGQKELSEKDFLNFEIGLPNINIQKKIGKLIENLDKKLKVEKINLELLMQQKQYLLANLFI